MISLANVSVRIQISSELVSSTPPWLGEVALITHSLRSHDIPSAIAEQVRFARRRFGHYDVIDFVAVLVGYAISSERTRGAPFMSGSSPGPARSWRSSDATGCLHARPSRAFWPP